MSARTDTVRPSKVRQVSKRAFVSEPHFFKPSLLKDRQNPHSSHGQDHQFATGELRKDSRHMRAPEHERHRHRVEKPRKAPSYLKDRLGALIRKKKTVPHVVPIQRRTYRIEASSPYGGHSTQLRFPLHRRASGTHDKQTGTPKALQIPKFIDERGQPLDHLGSAELSSAGTTHRCLHSSRKSPLDGLPRFFWTSEDVLNPPARGRRRWPPDPTSQVDREWTGGPPG